MIDGSRPLVSRRLNTAPTELQELAEDISQQSREFASLCPSTRHHLRLRETLGDFTRAREKMSPL